MTIKVTQKIPIYEINGVELAIGAEPELQIESHDDNAEFVVLHLGRKRIAVDGGELLTATSNAMNTGD